MSATPDGCFHLTVEIVQEIHQESLHSYGGADGIRELSLLESAIAAPQAGYGRKSVYVDLAEVASAYLFYLCRNHPFLDGNKRTALGACLVFLRINGLTPLPDEPRWEKLTLDVAASHLDREQTTVRLRALLPK